MNHKKSNSILACSHHDPGSGALKAGEMSLWGLSGVFGGVKISLSPPSSSPLTMCTWHLKKSLDCDRIQFPVDLGINAHILHTVQYVSICMYSICIPKCRNIILYTACVTWPAAQSVTSNQISCPSSGCLTCGFQKLSLPSPSVLSFLGIWPTTRFPSSGIRTDRTVLPSDTPLSFQASSLLF